MCSSESREGLAVCRQRQMLSPRYFKTLSITPAALQSSALPSQLMAGYQGTEKVLSEICRTVMCIKRKACVIGEKDEFRAVKYNK